MSKEFWIHIDMNDYRSGTNIYTYSKPPRKEEEGDDYDEDEDEYAPNEAAPYTFQIPEHYRVYIVADYPDYSIKGFIDTDEGKECKNLYLKMFSQLHDCLPFEVTGWNSSYKEEGEYPEVPDEIKKMPNVKIIEKMKEENKTGDYVYFVFAIDNEGDEVFSEML